MSSLLKIRAFSTTKSLNSFGHINSGDDFKKLLEEGQHEPYQPRETLVRPLSRVPTTAEFKAIIHSSACALNEILAKAPQLLEGEAKRLAKAEAKEQAIQKRRGSYTGEVKVPPSEYRKLICYGCQHKARKEAEEVAAIVAEQEDAKEQFLSYLKARRASREYGQFLDLTRDYYPEMDMFEDSSGRRLRNGTSAALGTVASRKPAWQFIGLNSKRSFVPAASAFGDLFRKDKMSPEKKKIMSYLRAGVIEHDWTWNPHGYGESEILWTEPKRKRDIGAVDSDQIMIIHGVPVTIGGSNSSISFPHWFGSVSALTPGAKKTVFDVRGYENNEIQLTAEYKAGTQLQICTKRRSARAKHVDTYFIPRPDTLKQYMFVRTPDGQLIIQKRPA